MVCAHATSGLGAHGGGAGIRSRGRHYVAAVFHVRMAMGERVSGGCEGLGRSLSLLTSSATDFIGLLDGLILGRALLLSAR